MQQAAPAAPGTGNAEVLITVERVERASMRGDHPGGRGRARSLEWHLRDPHALSPIVIDQVKRVRVCLGARPPGRSPPEREALAGSRPRAARARPAELASPFAIRQARYDQGGALYGVYQHRGPPRRAVGRPRCRESSGGQGSLAESMRLSSRPRRSDPPDASELQCRDPCALRIHAASSTAFQS